MSNEHVIRIGIVDGDTDIRTGRRLIIDSQSDFQVVFESDDAFAALENAPKLLLDVMLVDHRLRGMDGVHGVDLLAYRHQTVDPLELTRAVADAIGEFPLVAAGSVVRQEQIEGLARAGAWGFTIGGAVFDGVLPGDKDPVSQVRTALEFAKSATDALK